MNAKRGSPTWRKPIFWIAVFLVLTAVFMLALAALSPFPQIMLATLTAAFFTWLLAFAAFIVDGTR